MMKQTKKKRKCKVLTFEENTYHAQILKDTLEKKSGQFQLTIAVTPKETLTLLQHGKFDMILTDTDSESTPNDWISILKKKNPLTPLIILTSRGDERKAVAAMKEGADDYIIKNRSAIEKLPELLLQTITKRKLKKQEPEIQGIKGVLDNLLSLKEVINHPTQSLKAGKKYYSKQIKALEGEIKNLRVVMKKWF